MPIVPRCASRRDDSTTIGVRRRTVLGLLSQLMLAVVALLVVSGGGDVGTALRGGGINMDVVSEAGSESRNVSLKAGERDDELRGHWTSPKSMSTIAQAMDVKTCWVRVRATRLGLAPRLRSAITD